MVFYALTFRLKRDFLGLYWLREKDLILSNYLGTAIGFIVSCRVDDIFYFILLGLLLDLGSRFFIVIEQVWMLIIPTLLQRTSAL